jgi:menaquinone-9 beta-reductase
MTSTEIAVVGAGPAGSAAAITLAGAGREVVLIDRSRFPRDKTCGDGLTAGALRELEYLGLEPGRIGSWTEVHDAWLRSPSGRERRFPLPRGAGRYAVIARRLELDAALVDLARRAGAHTMEGVAVSDFRHDDDHGVLDLADGHTIRARYVIGADGAWSPLRKMMGLEIDGYRGEWHAFRQYFRDVGGRARHELLVWFEPDFLPGYAWSFPLADGGANVGFGITRGGSYHVGAMAALWRDLLRRPHVADALGPDAVPESPHRAWPIPARVDDVPLGLGRVLFVGDAAASADVLTGEGIGQALLTGRWAAEAALGAGPDDPWTAQRDYQRRVRDHLVADHRMSHLLTRAMGHRCGARTAIAVAGSTPWTRRNFARWLFEDYPRAVLFTPSRWRRRMFTGDGAFADGSSTRNVPATSEG